MPSSRNAIQCGVIAALSLFASCLPYTVGSTAQPVAPGEVRRSATVYVIPNAIDVLGDSASGAIRGLDVEARWGVTPDMDLGVRIPSASGVVVNAKHRVRGGRDESDAALAVMPGLGFVNWGQHAHFELSLLASGATRRQLTPYGGLRVMQVAPMSRGAAHDAPTAGAFFGLRIGNANLGISPEIGVFHDRSALELRKRKVIYVPAITVHGDDLMRIFGF